jgi:hypothetical protein
MRLQPRKEFFAGDIPVERATSTPTSFNHRFSISI